jgi:hypothetical protein
MTNARRTRPPAKIKPNVKKDRRRTARVDVVPLVEVRFEFDPRNNRKAGCFARRGAGNGDG